MAPPPRDPPQRLHAVLVGLDEELLPALARDVQPAAIVVDDPGVEPRPAHAGLLKEEHVWLF